MDLAYLKADSTVLPWVYFVQSPVYLTQGGYAFKVFCCMIISVCNYSQSTEWFQMKLVNVGSIWPTEEVINFCEQS